MNTIDFGVINAPRKIPTIGHSLDSFFETWGQREIHVFSEPGIIPYINQTKVIEHHNELTLGCVKNWLSAATWMLENTKSQFVGMLEDDIIWREEARTKITNLIKVLTGEIKNKYVEKFLPPVGFFSPYCSRMNSVDEKGWRKPRLSRKDGNKVKEIPWCGALCLIMPRESLRALISEQEYLLMRSAYFTKGQKTPRDLDSAIAETFAKLKMIILTHVPTLILHIGDSSTHERNNDPRVEDYISRQPAL